LVHEIICYILLFGKYKQFPLPKFNKFLSNKNLFPVIKQFNEDKKPKPLETKNLFFYHLIEKEVQK